MYKEERVLLFPQYGLQLRNKNVCLVRYKTVDDYEEVELEDDDRYEITKVDNK